MASELDREDTGIDDTNVREAVDLQVRVDYTAQFERQHCAGARRVVSIWFGDEWAVSKSSFQDGDESRRKTSENEG